MCKSGKSFLDEPAGDLFKKSARFLPVDVPYLAGKRKLFTKSDGNEYARITASIGEIRKGVLALAGKANDFFSNLLMVLVAQ